MEAIEFSKLHNTAQKIVILAKLSISQKESLVAEQEDIVDNNWDLCKSETSALYSKSFNDLNEKILHHDNLVSFVRWTYEKYKYGIRQQKSIFQWDIFYCDLGHNIGSEKNKTRPVIIVQRTIGFLNADTIMVAPITIGEDFDKLYKHEVVLDRTLRGKIKGKIDLSHIRAIDRSRLDERFTDRLLSKKEYEDIFKKVPYIMTQSKINSAMKEIFYIDGK